ncbi:TIGR02186 family protein [uncultured Litoreibacter sp.]|uniref:TIGR02186 family protein n=1 Tax=uncultured Litoreibacter sp. TaxID=1392394 RepID=UPI0026222555|nr:TIGR02186 family protein [uncultured Litoreibacter sp.]
MLRALALALCLLSSPLAAEEVVADLSKDEVAITANFDGSDILIYGAVKRDAPAAADPMQVIITVAGPKQEVNVRKKDWRYGIWVNTSAVEVDAAPSFYAVASSGALSDVLTETEDLRHGISIPRAIRSVGAPSDVENATEFTEALIRIRTKKNLYQQLDNTVNLFDETLFSTTIDLPANLVEGPYDTHIFLVRNGVIVDDYATVINVNKVGLERWIYDLAHQKPLIYGLLSLFIAIAAGWMASAVFRYIRF